MKQITKCPCGKEVQHKQTNNVGEICKLSGHYAVFSHTGIITYLCPNCSSRAKKLAEELVEIMGLDDFYIPSLLK